MTGETTNVYDLLKLGNKLKGIGYKQRNNVNYQNGWVWIEGAEIASLDTASNCAAIDRLCNEARNLYNLIPEVRRKGDDEDSCSAEDAQCEDIAERIETEFAEILTDEQREEVIQMAFEDLKRQKSEEKAAQFGQLEAIEQLMAQRGARFKRPYEHWNEDEKHIEYLERDRNEY